MSTFVYVIIAIVVVAAIIAIIVAATRRRSSGLRDRFGPEYDRTIETRGGDRKAAERELAGRVDRRQQLNIVPLAEPARQAYLASWQQVQANFVDAPVESVREADVLVGRVMSDRGYPMGEFEQRASDISVDHPNLVANYRGAHEVHLNSARGQASTEDLRRAMQQYRALFEELLGAGGEPAVQAQGTPASGAAVPAGGAADGSAVAAAPPSPPVS